MSCNFDRWAIFYVHIFSNLVVDMPAPVHNDDKEHFPLGCFASVINQHGNIAPSVFYTYKVISTCLFKNTVSDKFLWSTSGRVKFSTVWLFDYMIYPSSVKAQIGFEIAQGIMLTKK